MFAKLSIKYLLLAGTWVCLASVPACAGSTTTPAPSGTQAAAEPPKKKVPTKEELLAPEYVKKLSQTYGHFIRKNLDNPVVKLNVTDVMKGMQDATDGKPSPLKDGECEEAFRLLQQYAQEEMLKSNLEESETFLKSNSKQDGIVEAEPNKVQYKVLQSGSGDVVNEDAMITINYSATYLNGMAIGSSDQHGGPIEISLKETIPGFRKGMAGMKVGEKRRLFVHPDNAYGASGQHPNGLLMFDVEVVKISTRSPKEDGDSDSVDGMMSDSYQISDSDDDEEDDIDDDVDFEDTEDFDLPMMLDDADDEDDGDEDDDEDDDDDDGDDD